MELGFLQADTQQSYTSPADFLDFDPWSMSQLPLYPDINLDPSKATDSDQFSAPPPLPLPTPPAGGFADSPPSSDDGTPESPRRPSFDKRSTSLPPYRPIRRPTQEARDAISLQHLLPSLYPSSIHSSSSWPSQPLASPYAAGVTPSELSKDPFQSYYPSERVLDQREQSELLDTVRRDLADIDPAAVRGPLRELANKNPGQVRRQQILAASPSRNRRRQGGAQSDQSTAQPGQDATVSPKDTFLETDKNLSHSMSPSQFSPMLDGHPRSSSAPLSPVERSRSPFHVSSLSRGSARNQGVKDHPEFDMPPNAVPWESNIKQEDSDDEWNQFGDDEGLKLDGTGSSPRADGGPFDETFFNRRSSSKIPSSDSASSKSDVPYRQHPLAQTYGQEAAADTTDSAEATSARANFPHRESVDQQMYPPAPAGISDHQKPKRSSTPKKRSRRSPSVPEAGEGRSTKRNRSRAKLSPMPKELERLKLEEEDERSMVPSAASQISEGTQHPQHTSESLTPAEGIREVASLEDADAKETSKSSDEDYEEGDDADEEDEDYQQGGSLEWTPSKRRRTKRSHDASGNASRSLSNTKGKNIKGRSERTTRSGKPRRSTPEPTGEEIKCNFLDLSTGKRCQTIFRRPYDRTRHLDTVHAAARQSVTTEGEVGEGDSTNNKALVPRCDECGQVFSRKDALIRHCRIRKHRTSM